MQICQMLKTTHLPIFFSTPCFFTLYAPCASLPSFLSLPIVLFMPVPVLTFAVTKDVTFFIRLIVTLCDTWQHCLLLLLLSLLLLLFLWRSLFPHMQHFMTIALGVFRFVVMRVYTRSYTCYLQLQVGQRLFITCCCQRCDEEDKPFQPFVAAMYHVHLNTSPVAPRKSTVYFLQ